MTPEQALSIADTHMREMDARREEKEIWRSKHRNRNRLGVLVTTMIVSLAYPVVMIRWVHAPSGAYWTPALAAIADILVTAWAYWRRY